MEQAFPGFVAFVPTVPNFRGGSAVDLAQLIASVRSITDPGPAPDLATLVPRLPDPKPSPQATDARRSRTGRKAMAVLIVPVGFALMALGGPGIALGLIALVAAFATFFAAPEAVDDVGKRAKAAKAEWEAARKTFEQAAGNSLFLKARQDAEMLIKQVQNLPGEEARKIAELEAKRRDAQMRRHLERFKVTQAKVSGVGENRKLTLRSYGIETAADVDYGRVTAIRGFGPSIASNLVAWRRAAEAKFTFDPTTGVDPQDVAAVKADIAKNQSDLLGRIAQAVGTLRKSGSDAVASRTSLDPRYAAAWAAHRQAEADLKALGMT
jgi:DNA-binding helix-hairpin-helix protein with protein kinase domain